MAIMCTYLTWIGTNIYACKKATRSLRFICKLPSNTVNGIKDPKTENKRSVMVKERV